MREWLSGGAPPCQGGGRGFDPRLALFFIKGLEFVQVPILLALRDIALKFSHQKLWLPLVTFFQRLAFL